MKHTLYIYNRLKVTMLVLLCAVLAPQSAKATHIVGGYMTYECLSSGKYRVSLRVYRDCSSQNTNGTGFDPYQNVPAQITVYRSDNFNRSNPFRNFQIGAPVVTVIPRLSNPCMTIPGNEPCYVQEGLYRFDVDLPVSNFSYHIIYQRCCRNPSTININDPRNTGGTYEVEITPAAQRVCNDSPIFKSFPPILICAGTDINFDHSARDTLGNNERDSLAYEFCAPFDGGGPDGSVDPFGPNGLCPIPRNPPPHTTVQFKSPTYTASRPMGGNPIVSIDPVTGLISGVPTDLGQFSVGVCVKEYRNGELLSITRRDFQFVVTSCTPTVVADIKEDAKIRDKEYLINSCGENTVNFINESYDQAKIQSYKWVFDIKGTKRTFNTRDVTVTFPDTGAYSAVMIINEGLICRDTAKIFLNIFPDITADFRFEYDTCVAGPVAFTDLSRSGAGPISKWQWDFKDGKGSTIKNPSNRYNFPGEFDVSLQATDRNNCRDVIQKRVQFLPAPAFVVVEPSSASGCEPLNVFFNNLSTPIDSTYDIKWNFGDGSPISKEISPTHIYTKSGVYSVTLDITSPIGCNVRDSFNSLIVVNDSPTAGFDYNPKILSNFKSTVNFIDESVEAANWYWNFNDGKFSTLRNPIHTFRDTGYYNVMQIVTHASGCRDTLIRRLNIEPRVTYYLPNAFTPNGDDTNDGYKGQGFVEGMSDFKMTIWNRWGELIFETTDPTLAWNGRKNNEGDILQSGVYVCLVSFKTPRGQPVELKAFATLLR